MSDITPPSVSFGKVVLFHYTLTDDEGEVLDSSQGDEPMPYLHGAGNIVPGLEAEMEGRAVGDQFVAIIPPEKGYGVPQGEGPQIVPRSMFPDDFELEEGMPFTAEDEDGESFVLWVTEVLDDKVFIDANHPLAGVTLTFAIEITGIRDATKSEIEHGHPHGASGDDLHDHDHE